MAPGKDGEENRKCCSYEVIPKLDGSSSEEGYYDLSKSYWIVQNSFGRHWGDNGFIYIAAETGNGVNLLNRNIQTVQA